MEQYYLILSHQNWDVVFILAISGPTASGKTYFTKRLVEIVEEKGFSIEKISTDEFYHDLTHLSFKQRTEVNYDLPESIDAEAFEICLSELSKGKTTNVPLYDFTTHTRKEGGRHIALTDLLIVEGIFSLSFSGCNSLYDLRIFMELDQDLRLIRRLERDIKERGRSIESIVHQYLTQVRPTQIDHVLNDRTKADLILEGNKDHQKIFDLIIAMLFQVKERWGKNLDA